MKEMAQGECGGIFSRALFQNAASRENASMGLTIHYQLAVANRTPQEVRALIETLRVYAQSLSFKSVSKLIDLEGEKCALNPENPRDPHVWLKIQTTHFLTETEGDTARAIGEVHPVRLIAFTVSPGEGSEHANFGLCRYPDAPEKWSWATACKTQYASNPSAGDAANFLNCHLGIVAVLDKAKELGILEGVHDEGNYWDHRDATALVKEVGRWNNMVAGFYGMTRDAVEAAGGDPGVLKAEITKFGNFERLEAEGRKDEE
jgi:hypothetical protein